MNDPPNPQGGSNNELKILEMKKSSKSLKLRLKEELKVPRSAELTSKHGGFRGGFRAELG